MHQGQNARAYVCNFSTAPWQGGLKIMRLVWLCGISAGWVHSLNSERRGGNFLRGAKCLFLTLHKTWFFPSTTEEWLVIYAFFFFFFHYCVELQTAKLLICSSGISSSRSVYESPWPLSLPSTGVIWPVPAWLHHPLCTHVHGSVGHIQQLLRGFLKYNENVLAEETA